MILVKTVAMGTSIAASSQPRRSGVAACSETVYTMTDLAVRTYVLDIVIPVYNEERDLPGSIRRLHCYLATDVPYAARITVVDNASTDSTLTVAQALADELPDVDVIHIDEKGRGGALYTA